MPTWPALEGWDRWSDERKEDCERQITQSLQQRPAFTGLREFSLGSQRRKIATFPISDASWVLISGGPVSLGCDARAFFPMPEQLESYRDSAKEYGLDEDLRAFLATVIGRPRRGSEDGFSVSGR
jgi:hypothetical protein